MGSLDGLPIDLLQLIAEKMVDHADVLQFGAVCKIFRSIVTDNLHLLPPKLPLCLCVLPNKPPPLPLLMQCRDNEWENINFFSISDEKNHGEFLVPEMKNKWVAGSSHGWLCTLDIQGRDIQLLNPLTRAQIPLPSLDAFQHPNGSFDGEYDDFGFVEKAIILSDPSNMRINSENEDDRTLVMALISYFSVLSFCRVGDDKWTNVEDCLNHLQDVICYNGQIYAVDYEGITVIYDFAGDKKMRQIANAPITRGDEHRYLVESTHGDLLQVVRLFDDGREGICRSNDFKVYKLEAVDEPVEPVEGRPYYGIFHKRVIIRDKFKFKWVEMESLGEQALFLGKNYSLCIRTTGYKGCKPNCIYFTEHGLVEQRFIARGFTDEIDKDSVCDMGIHDLGDKKSQRFSQLNVKYLAPPIWISPNPW